MEKLLSDRITLFNLDKAGVKEVIEGNDDIFKKNGLIKGLEWPTQEIAEVLPEIFIRLERGEPSEYCLWVIAENESMEIIGEIGFKMMPDIYGRIEIGYGISPSYRRKGYAQEAVKAITNYAFNVKGLKTVAADSFLENYASANVLRKCGFREIGHDLKMIYWEKYR